MNKVLSLSSLALLGACAGTQPESSIIPPRFEPGAGESMTLIVPAKGVQIYECRANQAGAYEWTFVAPDAQLCMVLIEAGFGNLQIEESGTSWDSANTKATGPPISTRSRDCFSAGLLDGQRVGAALMAARSALFDRRHTIGEELGSVWAAYQHYRDPTRNVFDDRNPSTPRRAPAK